MAAPSPDDGWADSGDDEDSPRTRRKGLASTFAAEQSLLGSLAQPRVYKGDSYVNVRGNPDNVNEREDKDLTQFRSAHKGSNEVIDQELHDQTASLHHQAVTWTDPSTDYARLKASYLSRKARHEGAVNGYHHKLVDLCEDLEQRVIDASRDLRDYLAESTQRVDQIFSRLHDDLFMTGQDHTYVLGQWTAIDTVNKERDQTLLDFGAQLEGFEKERGHEGGLLLRELLHSLVDIAYILPGEVERLIEMEANEINLVMIGNFKAHTGERNVFVLHYTSVPAASLRRPLHPTPVQAFTA